ncbi:hypothetical protein HOLleu_32234 [Holothuria leucospilota]|uniref:Uncharacterized protein n=1 Tax=Holothuria leucospilota TaxID=206669 RepID=A0A9Q0YRB9_HOLLE|nr:hypothetical protein HOLleu_32234 [Holothuria leucospilota]
MDVGKLIQKGRQDKGMTQKDLATVGSLHWFHTWYVDVLWSKEEPFILVEVKGHLGSPEVKKQHFPRIPKIVIWGQQREGKISSFLCVHNIVFLCVHNIDPFPNSNCKGLWDRDLICHVRRKNAKVLDGGQRSKVIRGHESSQGQNFVNAVSQEGSKVIRGHESSQGQNFVNAVSQEGSEVIWGYQRLKGQNLANMELKKVAGFPEAGNNSQWVVYGLIMPYDS